MVPSALSLILNTHLQSIGILPGGNSVTIQVPLASKATSYMSIASIHFGFFAAWAYDVGSMMVLIECIRCLMDDEGMLV